MVESGGVGESLMGEAVRDQIGARLLVLRRRVMDPVRFRRRGDLRLAPRQPYNGRIEVCEMGDEPRRRVAGRIDTCRIAMCSRRGSTWRP